MMNEALLLVAFITERTLVDRLLGMGYRGMAGMLAIILAGVLVSVFISRIVRGQRRSWPILVLAMLLAIGGSAAYDWQHLKLNLAMRDVTQVRADCARILEDYRNRPDQRIRSSLLDAPAIPESLRRIGARWVSVGDGNVYISLTPYSNLTGSAWGILYDPEGTFQPRYPEEGRPLWYRDFREFAFAGE